jgi:hypothetical protein
MLYLLVFGAGVFAMRLRTLSLLLAACAALAATSGRAEVLIQVDKSAQVMTVTVDGAQRYAWKVSTGMADYDTPEGEFQAFRMERDHFSREWDDAPMPYSIFFTQEGHAIHGSFDVKHLGRPASHGCVRLSKEHAAILYELVTEQGLKATHVVLSGDIPDSDAGAIARREPALTYDDDVRPPRRQRVRTARGWRETQDGPRYYYYREGPYVPPRHYGDGGRSRYPYGW